MVQGNVKLSLCKPTSTLKLKDINDLHDLKFKARGRLHCDMLLVKEHIQQLKTVGAVRSENWVSKKVLSLEMVTWTNEVNGCQHISRAIENVHVV